MTHCVASTPIHENASASRLSNCEASPSGDSPSTPAWTQSLKRRVSAQARNPEPLCGERERLDPHKGNHPRMEPRILEPRVFHSCIREIFVDGFYEKLSACIDQAKTNYSRLLLYLIQVIFQQNNHGVDIHYALFIPPRYRHKNFLPCHIWSLYF